MGEIIRRTQGIIAMAESCFDEAGAQEITTDLKAVLGDLLAATKAHAEAVASLTERIEAIDVHVHARLALRDDG